METAEEKKVQYGSYLIDKIVDVKPVEAGGKWSTLLVAGQEKRKDAFLYDKVKRSYQIPLRNERNGGGVVPILDDQERKLIAKYETTFPQGMTQKEFFEKELGVDLNHTLPINSNFWRTDRRGRVVLTKKGVSLNLNQSIDMLKYLILMSNKQLIAPSYELRLTKASYEFMIVDQNKVVSKRLEEAELKAAAWAKFAEVTATKHGTIGFIKSLGKTIPASALKDTPDGRDWLKGEVLKVLENSPKFFLEVVNHPQYKEKIFIQEAVEVGAILRKGEKRYTLDNGQELGDLGDVIRMLTDPENQDFKLRVQSKIEMAKNR